MDTMAMTTTAAMPQIMDELSAEHAGLLPRLAELAALADTGGPALAAAVGALADELETALERHIAQEDDVLFPALACALDDAGMVQHFVDEHREILHLRDALLAAHRGGDDTAMRHAAADLAALMTAHMTREDMMLFPTARDRLG